MFCTDDGTLDLFNELGGSPDAGGSWSGPSTLTNGDQGTFDPSTMSAGTYTYSVSGTAPCTDLTAEVEVTLNNPPTANAGPATIESCSADPFTNAATAANYASLEWDNIG